MRFAFPPYENTPSSAAGGRPFAVLRELHRMQPRIRAVAREELRVRPALDDAPLLHHHDHVGALDRRQAVRDHERRAPGHHAVERRDPIEVGAGEPARRESPGPQAVLELSNRDLFELERLRGAGSGRGLARPAAGQQGGHREPRGRQLDRPAVT